MRRLLPWLVLLALRPVGAMDFADRFCWLMSNLGNDQVVEPAIAVLAKAKAAGCTGVMLADWPISHQKMASPTYPANVARFLTKARRLGLKVIPCVFDVGYSNGLLKNDPNLASGLPVREAEFVVKDGLAAPQLSPGAKLLNGDLRQARGDKLTGWAFQDQPGATTFVEPAGGPGGLPAVRFEQFANPARNGRITQTIKVEPFHAYHLSFQVRTEAFERAKDVRVAVLSDGGRFEHNYTDLGLAPTTPWRRCHIVFNSLTATEVTIYLGVWGGRGGKLWFSDIRLEPAGLVNIIRRDLCPLKVVGADGTVYQEGRDFEPIVDPKLGRVAGAPGHFKPWHGPPVLKLTPNSLIKDGQVLRLSYFQPAIIHQDDVPVSIEDPKVFDLFREEIAGAVKLFDAPGYMMSYDEWRCGGWETDLDRPAGQKLAAHVKRAAQLIREAAPGAAIYVWNDLFDPYHNAVKSYYLVNGSLEGSWEGLDKDIVIANWNLGKFAPSAQFFADRGHKQVLCGYYDAPPQNVLPLLGLAAKIGGVTGLMYTTWQANYGDMGRYFELAREFKP